MTEPPGQAVPLVVLLPEVLGRSFFDPAPREVLELWRDKKVRLVVDRALITRYLRLLGRMGVSTRCLRWWGWWFSSADKVEYYPGLLEAADFRGHCLELARKTGASAVLHAGNGLSVSPDGKLEGVSILSASDFMQRFRVRGG